MNKVKLETLEAVERNNLNQNNKKIIYIRKQ